MSELSILTVIFQVAFCVHVIKYDKDKFWLFIIILVPLLGCIIYFLTQILPEMLQSRQVKRAGNTLINTLDPQRDIRRLQDELQISDSIENRLALADAYLQTDQPTDAIPLYERCLTGIHENDPDIMLKLSQALFMTEDYQKAKTILDQLIAANPDYKSHDGHLLYAKTLEALQMTEEAVHEYEKLAKSYPGEEARVRYGLLLKKTGHEDKARELFKETLTRIKRAPKFYLKKEKYWIEIASENLE